MHQSRFHIATKLPLALLFLTTSLTFAADKPNFTGSWKMDLAKSDFGGGPPPDSFTRKIEHKEPSLIMADEQVSPLGQEKAVRAYTTDGKEITYVWTGEDVKSAVHWEGDTLITVGKLNVSGTAIVVNATITLSSDGKTLTETDKIVAEGNEIATFKLVMVKQ